MEGSFLRRLDRDAKNGSSADFKDVQASKVSQVIHSALPIGPRSMAGFYLLRIYAWWMIFRDSMEAKSKHLRCMLGFAKMTGSHVYSLHDGATAAAPAAAESSAASNVQAFHSFDPIWSSGLRLDGRRRGVLGPPHAYEHAGNVR